ncbi:MAG: antibiotic biosynthesis monooxygenase [Chloroflexota bacterium]
MKLPIFLLLELGFLSMIIRLWRGRTLLSKADEYENLMRQLAIPDYSAVDGLLDYYFTRTDYEAYSEFLLITHWDNLENIKSFAGEDYQKAKYYDEDKDYLLDFPEFVEHFQVFAHSK